MFKNELHNHIGASNNNDIKKNISPDVDKKYAPKATILENTLEVKHENEYVAYRKKSHAV